MSGSPGSVSFLVPNGGFIPRGNSGGVASSSTTFIVQELRFAPAITPPALGAGSTNNYTPTGWLTTSRVRQATNVAGSTVTGLGAAVDGDVRLFENLGPGLLTLANESGSSLAANRIIGPGGVDLVLAVGGAAFMIYDGTSARWRVDSASGDLTASASFRELTLTPAISPPALAAGVTNDYNPTGFSSTTMMRITPDATTSTLNGMVAQSDGDIRIIENIGTGQLVLANEAVASVAANRFATPGAFNVTLDAGGVAQCIYDATTARWRVIATDGLYNQQLGTNGFLNFGAGSQRGGMFYTNSTQTMGFYNPTTRLQFNTAVMTGGLGQVWTAAIAPPQLTGTTNDYAPTGFSGTWSIRQDVGTGGAVLTGIAGGVSGREILLINIATNPQFTLVLTNQDTRSVAANRFALPNSAPYVIPAGGAVHLRYDGSARWVIVAGTGDALPQTPQFITPAVFAAGDVNDYDPSDAVSGVSGRIVPWWHVQGAVGTNLTGISATPAGKPAYGSGARILLTNYASGLTIKHSSVLSSAGNRFNLPGGVDLVLPGFGSVEFIYDLTNAVWYTT